MRKLNLWLLRARLRLRYAADDAAEFLCGDDGIGTVEMILILVVLIGLVLIFKDSLGELVGNIFETIESKSESVGE